jgi:hypothetical protein
MRFSRYISFITAQTFLSVLIAICSILPLIAQDIRVRATLDTTGLRIGEQTNLRLTVEHPSGVQVKFPSPADTLSSNIEIVQRSGIDSSVENGRSVQSQSYTITSFAEGLHDIPSLTVNYRKPNDTTLYSIQTQALALSVQTVKVDTTSQEIRDIKPPLALERTFAEILPYLLIAFGAIALIVGGVYWWKKRKPAEVFVEKPPVPETPPYQVAMEALEKLHEERLWQKGEEKEYHSRLTDILRVYVEKTYHITTLEATTDEILAQFRLAAAPAGATEMLRSVLTKADMVKFARYKPLPDEHDRSLNSAREFVTITTLTTQTEPLA